MKTKKLLLAVLLATVPFFGFAQEWDDIYANPSESNPVSVQQKRQPQKRVVVVQGDVTNMEVTANGRSIDEYNRRSNDNTFDGQANVDDTTYQDYQYTDRIIRFHDPESSVKISGADEVIVYVGDDLYDNYYRHRGGSSFYYGMGWGWNSYYPWYDPWYDPWYYSSWHSPWYYSRWHSPWYGGWHRPWYSSWYSPFHYGGWYDPWYYGGYYGSYYGGYGGYYGGFYDGYYLGSVSNRATNRSGRSSGVYRTSSANRSTASAAGLSGRSSSFGNTRTATSGRSSSAYTRGASTTGRTSSAVSRSSSSSPRTRIIDNSGRAYDSRTGRVIDRSGTTSRSSSINRATQSRSSSVYNSNRSSSTYERPSAPTRSSSSRDVFSSPSRSSSSRSSTYSTPSRSSSSSRSSTYSTPSSSSRSSSSGSFGSSRSSSSGSFGGGSSSGRSSGGRR